MNARPSLSGARWGHRPPDQRFDTVPVLREALTARRASASTRALDPASVRALPGTEGIVLDVDGEHLVPSAFAAAQISSAVGLPAKAVRVLSPELGAAALNERFERSLTEGRGLRADATLLVEERRDGPTRLRSVQSSAYSRTWDLDVLDQLVEPILAEGWVPAAASVHRPDTDRALFSSDRDLFCFLVCDAPGHELPTPHGRPLRRGIVIRNSEVGGISLQLRAFWFDSFCTNHMVFGGSMAVELVEPHRVGKAPPLQRLLDRWHAVGGLRALERSRIEEERIIRRAMQVIVARPSDRPRQVEDDAVEAVATLARRARVATLLPRTLLRAGVRRRAQRAGRRQRKELRKVELATHLAAGASAEEEVGDEPPCVSLLVCV